MIVPIVVERKRNWKSTVFFCWANGCHGFDSVFLVNLIELVVSNWIEIYCYCNCRFFVVVYSNLYNESSPFIHMKGQRNLLNEISLQPMILKTVKIISLKKSKRTFDHSLICYSFLIFLLMTSPLSFLMNNTLAQSFFLFQPKIIWRWANMFLLNKLWILNAGRGLCCWVVFSSECLQKDTSWCWEPNQAIILRLLLLVICPSRFNDFYHIWKLGLKKLGISTFENWDFQLVFFYNLSVNL